MMKTYETTMLSEQQSGGMALDDEIKRGIAASEAGDKAGAELVFRQIVAQRPDALEAWIWLGWTSTHLDSSEVAFTRAASLDPKNEEAQLGLRWVASQRGHPSQPLAPLHTEHQVEVPIARASQETAIDTSPVTDAPTANAWDFGSAMRQAVAAAQAGDKPSANAMFRRIAERQPEMSSVWVWYGGTSASLEDAEAAFSRAQHLDPTNEEATLGLRWVALRRQVLRQTSPGLDRAVVAPASNLYPTSTSTDNLTGDALPWVHDQHTPAQKELATIATARAGMEDVKPAKKLSAFARFLKKFNIPLPVILLVIAVAVVWTTLVMVLISGPVH